MADQRERILSAAAEIFADAGFAGARVDAIARRARLNKRLLYHYVGDKQALFQAVLEAAAGDVSRPVLEQRRFWRLLMAEQERLGFGPLAKALVGFAAGSGDASERLGSLMLARLLPELQVALGEAASAAQAARGESGSVVTRDPEAAKPRLRLSPQVLGVPERSSSKRSK